MMNIAPLERSRIPAVLEPWEKLARLRPYHILVGHGQQVALLVAQLPTLLRHGFHGGGHVIIALGLLRQLGLLHQVVLVHALGFRTEKKKRVSVWTPKTSSFKRRRASDRWREGGGEALKASVPVGEQRKQINTYKNAEDRLIINRFHRTYVHLQQRGGFFLPRRVRVPRLIWKTN